MISVPWLPPALFNAAHAALLLMQHILYSALQYAANTTWCCVVHQSWMSAFLLSLVFLLCVYVGEGACVRVRVSMHACVFVRTHLYYRLQYCWCAAKRRQSIVC
jgi:hypothetical protein